MMFNNKSNKQGHIPYSIDPKVQRGQSDKNDNQNHASSTKLASTKQMLN